MAESTETEEVTCDHTYKQNMDHGKTGIVVICSKCGKQLRSELMEHIKKELTEHYIDILERSE